MGVFDYITCEYPLPDGLDTKDIELQTKDTDAQYLERYKITKDGKLLHETGEYEVVPKNERPYPNAADGTLESICGIQRMKDKRWIEVPFHGDLGFYGTDKNNDWHEYIALFDTGKLLNIKKCEA